ncbi:MAG TPA: signal peptide prediction [Burkholderiales bacterium]
MAWSKTIRYLWASPATLVGLLLASIACLMRADLAAVNGVIEVVGRGGRLPGLLRCPFVAITFGHVIIARDRQSLEGCRAHERAHVRQYERWGALFFLLYLGSSAYEYLRGRRLYWDNYFERQARAEAEVACDVVSAVRRS